MSNFEKNILPNAERRRKQAEENEELSLSHWRGELHAHTKKDISEPRLPEEIVENRRGSNCGKIPLEVLVRYHAREMQNEFLAITEHSRDASPDKAVRGITNWFTNMYLNNEEWLENKFGHGAQELTKEEIDFIGDIASRQAEEVAYYGDERLQQILDDIDTQSGCEAIRTIKGVEVNLLSDGTFDTKMISEGKFELVNVSIHDQVDPAGFENIMNDPQAYSDLVIKGIDHPKTNIMTHIGEGLESSFTERLDWPTIFAEALRNKVAIEINLKKLMDFLDREMMDYDKYPKSDNSWRDVWTEKLNDLIPIISNEELKDELREYFSKGLVIAINTDQHDSRFIKSKVDEAGISYNFEQRDRRYWIALKILEKYFNKLFTDLGVSTNNILNTYQPEELKKFLAKN